MVVKNVAIYAYFDLCCVMNVFLIDRFHSLVVYGQFGYLPTLDICWLLFEYFLIFDCFVVVL